MVSVHGMAGAKMGSAEATSVINPEGRLWHFENIFVCDSSALPSNLGESPQGTIMAYSAGLAESFLS